MHYRHAGRSGHRRVIDWLSSSFASIGELTLSAALADACMQHQYHVVYQHNNGMVVRTQAIEQGVCSSIRAIICIPCLLRSFNVFTHAVFRWLCQLSLVNW
jgi:hypothetical protein